MKPHYRKIPAANSRESAQSTAMALFGVSTTPPVTRLVVGSRFGWVIPKHLRNFYLIVSWRLSSARTRSEEHTSELQSLMRISYAVFCLKKKKIRQCKQTSKRE